MKKHLHSAFCLGAAAATPAAATLSTQAQVWLTLDHQYTPGLTAVSGDVATDPFGHVFAVGRGTRTVEGDQRALVRRSSNQGKNWETLDAYQEPGFFGAHYRAFAASDADHLFVGGQIDQGWIIRESPEGVQHGRLPRIPHPSGTVRGGRVPTLRSIRLQAMPMPAASDRI